MLTDKDVQIELDVSERDKYGRLLCYLYIDGKMFNEILLEQGYARVAYVFAPNTKYVDQFRAIQDKAREREEVFGALKITRKTMVFMCRKRNKL